MGSDNGDLDSLYNGLNGISLDCDRAHTITSNDSESDCDSAHTEVPLSSPDSGKGLSLFYSGNPGDIGSNGSSPPENSESFGQKPGRSVLPYARGGFRNSRTWMSSDTKHMQDFVVVRNAMRRLFKHSDVAKWKYADYIAHREAMIASEKVRIQRQVKAKEEERQRQLAQAREQDDYIKTLSMSVDSRLHLRGNLSLVLGEKTIWCMDWQNGKDEISPWPSFAEMKWEGDDRAKTAVGRFLPLPREMGAPGITWSQLQCVEQFPLDQVARIPTMEDIYLPVDEIDDDLKYNFITKELEEAIDAYLET